MNDPVRLLNEAPDSDLSSALRAEHDLASALDGAALKGRLLANVAAGALPSALSATASTWTTTALPTVLAGLVGVGVGVAGTLAVVERQTPAASIVATVAPRVEEVPAASLVTTPVAPPEPASPPSPERPAWRAEPSSPASSAASSSLVDETRRYERAEAALRDSRPAVAVDELAGYLRAYPKGSLSDEVRLTLLEALFAAERFRDARDLAKNLVADPDLAERHGEIVRLLIRSRVQLGECAAASRDLAAVRGAAPALTKAVAQCRGADPHAGAVTDPGQTGNERP